VIQEAWIGGVPTRRDRRSGAGNGSVGDRQVAGPSKLCNDTDECVHALLDRRLAGEWPYLWLYAT
jgi:putative transposase